MRRNRLVPGLDAFGSLEQRISLSAVSLATTRVAIVSTDLPPPEPEPDPGPFPGDDPPIVYPPVPPSGPVGPGIRR
jgi:hypothetical protein